MCEPFIVAKRIGIDGYQLWSTAQLENKLIDMREKYNEKITGSEKYHLIHLAIISGILGKALFTNKLTVQLLWFN